MERYDAADGYPGGVEKPSPVGDLGESLDSREAELEREGDGRIPAVAVGSVAMLLWLADALISDETAWWWRSEKACAGGRSGLSSSSLSGKTGLNSSQGRVSSTDGGRPCCLRRAFEVEVKAAGSWAACLGGVRGCDWASWNESNSVSSPPEATVC